ncbi:MAG: type II toxin-antitoxin system RelB/DinJ family antitoxin [Turicibacter sp.]|nr:type II toxin-antitoxin system RelB/DinJ family antitoxin [Turicibacter sp.]
MAELTIKLDDNVQNQAETVFKGLGLTVAAAVNLFFQQTIADGELPFTPTATGESRRMTDEEYNRYFNPVNLAVLEESDRQAKNGEFIVKTMKELESYE